MKKQYRLFKRFVVILACMIFFQACADTSTTSKRNSNQLFSEKLEKGMKIQYDKNHPRVQAQIKSFKNQRTSIFTHLDKERLIILNYIVSELDRRNMPFELAMMPLIESSYTPAASNRGRHVGLWQLGGPTARTFGVKVGGGVDGRYNIKESTNAALDYLAYLNKMFDGDWLLTIAAYNAGEGRVLGSMTRNDRNNRKMDYWSLNLPNVTEDYIPKVLALSQLAVNDRHLKVSLKRVPELVGLDVSNLAEVKDIIRDNAAHDSLIVLYNPRVNNAMLKDHQILLPESILSKRKLEKYKEYN